MLQDTQNTPLLAGLEAGGTNFNCVLARDPRTILARARFPTEKPERTLAKVLAFFREESARLDPLGAMGIASFGPVDNNRASPDYGRILNTPKRDWVHIDLLGWFREHLGVPVNLETDVNGAALAEQRLGAAQGIDNFIYVTVGTGIGAGIVMGGRIINGFTHPEVGHMRMSRDANRDPFPGCCPFHGDCLEGLACGPALELRWRRPGTELPPAHQAWELQADYLAQMCANLTYCYAPERIILGGGVMQNAFLFPLIRERVQQLLNGYGPPPALAHPDSYIVPPALGGESGQLGALLLAQQQLHGNPPAA
ncbi:ROK family protein [Microbulbifer rhizosphaerae]|uniref:fructokinase n=1 Tax=Microbulbifer rhizosphaerae TaxID=1562603 RepID=A0A7W4Z7C5_9GAMM|nr:ROK family protein [Microbulbifer rhizosphaerae]MBB3059593.1 fructokinase [Microbulbifer rhizosphaerae]